MVFGPDSLTALSKYGGSMALRAEDIYREHGPCRATVQTVLLRLWTGHAPSSADDAAEVAKDPAAQLPSHGVQGFEPKHKEHQRGATLFQEEDLVPWIVFTMVFIVLVIFDNAVLHRKNEKLTLLKSILYTTFWIAVAGMFNCYVWYTRGVDDAFSWGTGYILEWMLSVDNLFVFHRIFQVFKTPDDQKHKPLFYGIVGAIVFRMIFFVIEEILLHHVTWMHLVFGLFLIYTGVKAVQMDDEDESPDQGCFYAFLTQQFKYVDKYDTQGRFFIPVPIDKVDMVLAQESARGSASARSITTPASKDANLEEAKDDAKDGNIIKEESSKDFKVDKGSIYIESTYEVTSNTQRGQVKYLPTRLVLVVLCLEVTDLVFAVDSVSAIVAQIPDLFLAYTACVFAMLGLRAMFFAIDKLVDMFVLLGYGVAFILIFLGVKLILRSWIHIPPKIVCCILISTLAISIFASQLFYDHADEKSESSQTGDNAGDTPEDTKTNSARAEHSAHAERAV
jgi:tellurite resistance protein TerC